MSLCDVCARPSAGEVIPNAVFRRAVRDGYNPFAMGLSGPTGEQIATMAQISGTDPYAMWLSRLADREMTDWLVCDGCLPALRPFLDRTAGTPSPPSSGLSVCSKCGEPNPASQWHCSHCGHIQWGLIIVSLIVGLGLALWALDLASWWGRGIVGALALLFLWIGVGSIREGLRNQRYR